MPYPLPGCKYLHLNFKMDEVRGTGAGAVSNLPRSQQRMIKNTKIKLPTRDLFSYFNDHQSHLTYPIIQRMFTEIVTGVADVHSHGSAHRDISLESVFVDNNLRCFLGELECVCSTGLQCDGMTGKEFYMAPEIWQRHSATYNGIQADVWSLGILLFILLTGNPPFERAIETDRHYQLFQQHGIKAILASYQVQLPQDAVDLLEKIFTITTNEILHHPFITTGSLQQISLFQKVLLHLKYRRC